jgi:hypothetical protein
MGARMRSVVLIVLACAAALTAVSCGGVGSCGKLAEVCEYCHPMYQAACRDRADTGWECSSALKTYERLCPRPADHQ